MEQTVIQKKEGQKFVKSSELILYLVAVFFYTNMTGMVGNYRNAYIVNVLRLSDSHASLYNTLLSLIPFSSISSSPCTSTAEGSAKRASSDRSGCMRPFRSACCLC